MMIAIASEEFYVLSCGQLQHATGCGAAVHNTLSLSLQRALLCTHSSCQTVQPAALCMIED